MPLSVVGAVGGLAAAAGAVSNLAGGGSGGSPGGTGQTNVYQPPLNDLSNQNNNLTNLLNDYGGYASGLFGSVPNQVNQQLGSYLNNPYAGNYIGGSLTGQQQGFWAGDQSATFGNQLSGLTNQASSMIGGGQQYANQLLQQAFDPNGQLYDQGVNQTMNQQNAINSMNGVAGSPYAAGVAGQALTNFNTNWQQTQQQNEANALGAYNKNQQSSGAMLGDVASAYGNSAALDQNASVYYGQAAAMPYNAYGSIYGNNLGQLGAAYGDINSGLQPGNNAINAGQAYLGYGQGANLAGANYQNQQNQQNLNNLSSGLQSLTNPNSSIYQNLSNFFSSNPTMGDGTGGF